MLHPTVAGGPWRVRLVAGVAGSVAISGFDVTLGVTMGTTTQEVVDAVNNHSVLGGIMSAELVGTSEAVLVLHPYTSIPVEYLTAVFVDGDTGLFFTTRNHVTDIRVSFAQSGTGVHVTVSDHDIAVTYQSTVSTLQDIVNAILNDPDASALVDVVLGNGDATATLTASLTAVNTRNYDRCFGTVLHADDLYLWLYDEQAHFLTDGVRVGDVLEIPLDPNNYDPAAFDGRLLSYPVAQVISENRLAIPNLGTDTASRALELPHRYLRDFADRLLDNETSATQSAINYRIRRTLSKDDQVTAIITAAQSLKSKRATVTFPDVVAVAGLKDGSLPRSVATIRTAAALQPGWFIACQVAGALAGLPVQQGLTNLGLVGVSRIYHSSGYFREAQLTQISNGGVFVMHQRVPTELPFCIHQLTTDPAALETGELSVVKNIDFISVYFQEILEGFLGQYNVLPETLTEIQRSIIDSTDRLKARKIGRIGAPLIEGSIQSLRVSDVSGDRVVLFFSGKVARPLNNVDFHLVA